MIWSMLRSRDGSAAVETALFSPIFVILTLAIADLGSGMFTRMTVNAAAQAGAAYAVMNPGASLNDIRTRMNEAAGDPSFCTIATCSAPPTGVCADGSGQCVIVSATYPWTPMLSATIYSWAISNTVTSAITVRVL
jgi:Flp pilus assembly protein TadG